MIIVYKASLSSSLCFSTRTLGGEAGLRGRDYVPLHGGDSLQGGEVAACIYWLDYEEGEEKDPEFLAASPRSPSSPALLAKHQPAPGV